MIDVNAPALEGRDQIEVPVPIEIADNQGPTRQGASRAGRGEGGVERPISRPVTDVHLDPRVSIPEQDQIQMAVPVDVGELGGHMPVFPPQHLFGEAPPAVAQEGLHAAEVAGHYDVREPVAVDVPRGEGAVADIAPGGSDWIEATFTVAEPDVEGRAGEPGGRDEIEVTVPIEIDKEGLKPPLLSLSQGGRQGIAGKSPCGSGDGGAARHDPHDRGKPARSSPGAEHGGLEMPSLLAPRQRRPHGGWARAQPPVC